LSVKLWTLAGDMATRFSPVLISEGIPIITQFSLSFRNLNLYIDNYDEWYQKPNLACSPTGQ